jgi:hypothetical protein
MPVQKISIERRKVNEGLVQDVKEMKAMISQLLVADAARVERELQTRTDVDGLKKTVNGNGVPGLKTDVQLLKEQMTRVYWLGGVLVVALISNFIAMWFK